MWNLREACAFVVCPLGGVTSNRNLSHMNCNHFWLFNMLHSQTKVFQTPPVALGDTPAWFVLKPPKSWQVFLTKIDGETEVKVWLSKRPTQIRIVKPLRCATVNPGVSLWIWILLLNVLLCPLKSAVYLFRCTAQCAVTSLLSLRQLEAGNHGNRQHTMMQPNLHFSWSVIDRSVRDPTKRLQ